MLFSISVPVNRYRVISDLIERQCRWRSMKGECSYFEVRHRMDSWSIDAQRFVFIRQVVKTQIKGPIQLDLFAPRDNKHQHKVIVTNKKTKAANVMAFHDGRGSQEGLYAALKSQLALGYIPTNTWIANKVYLLSVVFAHNLARELQMQTSAVERSTTVKRPALWKFVQLDTLRKTLIQRAGRLIRPQGKLTLSMSANTAVKERLEAYLGTNHTCFGT